MNATTSATGDFYCSRHVRARKGQCRNERIVITTRQLQTHRRFDVNIRPEFIEQSGSRLLNTRDSYKLLTICSVANTKDDVGSLNCHCFRLATALSSASPSPRRTQSLVVLDLTDHSPSLQTALDHHITPTMTNASHCLRPYCPQSHCLINLDLIYVSLGYCSILNVILYESGADQQLLGNIDLIERESKNMSLFISASV
ncbi:hypothetical protein RRG08_057903 [Elysia crispata]|uniref:Uncharacterized protein n=1 Tax=Elysia crispata TaxID=231223 RepID=A0AAE0ZRU7_9GAST|nr:hypothetical protein RRG08_057903 [Elysia crispata]